MFSVILVWENLTEYNI